MARRLSRSTEWIEDALKSERAIPEQWSVEWEKSYEEALRMRIAAERLRAEPPAPQLEPERIPCPLCGAPTTGQRDWYGSGYQGGLRWGDHRKPYIGPKKGEWDCTKDHRHYLWAKANEMLVARDSQPKNLAEWEAYDGQKEADQRLEAVRDAAGLRRSA